MNKLAQLIIFSALCAGLLFTGCSEQKQIDIPQKNEIIEVLKAPPPVEAQTLSIMTQNDETISEEDINLLALITMAEAEGEPEKGKRLVIDTVLNRMDSIYFPDTVHDVIYQPYHFTPVWNGRLDRCEVRDDICKLVREELESRTNRDVIFFQAGDFSIYGKPMFQVGHHYFSSYD